MPVYRSTPLWLRALRRTFANFLRPAALAALALSVLAVRMPAQPVAPTPDQLEWLRKLTTERDTRHPEVITQAPAALSVDISDRANVRAFYNAIFGLSEGIPSGWTGTLSGTPGTSATGSAGTTSAAFHAAEQLRINWFRAMGGIPANIGFDPVNYSPGDAQAALMMSANNALDHFPPMTWQLYTAAGYTAANDSNLSLGVDGPDAITGYMIDVGTNNIEVGHRRWILYPQTQTMGSGDVDAVNGFSAANATWVLDGLYGTTRPTTRDGFVAWPPPGYVPYQVVFPRWSFGYGNADFSNATVTMTSNGASVPVQLETYETGYGENTLVWDYNGLDGNSVQAPAPQPSADTTYNVTISGISGAPQTSYSYSVTVFDPAAAGSGDSPPTVNGSAQATVGINSSYSVAGIPSFANGFVYRTITSMSPVTTTWDPNGSTNSLDGVVAVTSGTYSPVDTTEAYSGTSASYHLAQPDISTQTLTLPGYYTVPSGSSASLQFESWLGYADSTQTAHVQISFNDGASWSDLFTETGNTDTTEMPVESGFGAHTLSLKSYAGLVFQIRFAYIFTQITQESGWDDGTSTRNGWNIDAISLTGVDSVTPGARISVNSGTSFDYAPATTGSFGLQASEVLFGLYPVLWGPVANVTASAQSGSAPAITTQPESQSLNTGSTVVFTGAASNATSYQWLINGSPISNSPGGTTSNIFSGATGPQLVISNATAASNGSYTLSVTGSGGSTSSNAATLAVAPASNPGYLINISARAFVGTGSNIMIGGFYIVGSTSRSVLIQAIGPGLAGEGVTGVLQHPALSIHNSAGATIYSNTGWGSSQLLLNAAAAAYANPVLKANSADSELLLTLPPGGYTAEVAGGDGGTGVALCAIYQLP
jgi:hypothetical protein